MFIVGDETEIRRLGGCAEPFGVDGDDQERHPAGSLGSTVSYGVVSGVFILATSVSSQWG